MKRAALYVRVSTAEQRDHGLSIDSQLDALKKYCAENSFEIAGIYNDAGISARSKYTKRPALLRLLEDCKAKKIDIVLFTKLDRWFRSVSNYYEVQKVLDGCRVPWQAIWEDYETVTSAGQFKTNIMLSVAQAESDRTSERIKAVKQYIRETGGYVGSAPTGYMLNKRDLIKNPAEEAAVNAFFDSFRQYKSITRACDVAASHGLVISRDHARDMLQNEAYCGHTFGYSCEPYITEEEYRDYSDLIVSRSGKKYAPKRIYLFSTLLKCPVCGSSLSGSARRSTKSKSGYEWRHYVCSTYLNRKGCSFSSYLGESNVEKYLLGELENVISDYRIRAKAEKANNAEQAKKKASLEAKLRRIGERYEDGDISRAEYVKKRDFIRLQISSIKMSEAGKLPELPTDWRTMYSELTAERKQEFWASFIKEILVDRDDEGWHFDIRFI